MSLQEQKNIFLKSAKGIKALAYANKWFNDFVSSKLEPYYLQIFYSNEKYNGIVPLSAEKDFNDYELMFWFWFYQRYDRLQTEKQMAEDIIKYQKEIKEIEANNPLNIFTNLLSESKNLLFGLGGLFIVYKLLNK